MNHKAVLAPSVHLDEKFHIIPHFFFISPYVPVESMEREKKGIICSTSLPKLAHVAARKGDELNWWEFRDAWVKQKKKGN